MRFQPLERLINLHDGYRRTVKIDQLDVLILQEEDRLYIVQSRCPHREHPLEGGDVEGGMLICPLHHLAFDLSSGNSVGGLCAPLRCWTPVYEGNEVGILVEHE